MTQPDERVHCEAVAKQFFETENTVHLSMQGCYQYDSERNSRMSDRIESERAAARQEGAIKARQEALEEAAKAECPACRDGCVGGGIYSIVPIRHGRDWHHVMIGSSYVTQKCHVQAIRDLIAREDGAKGEGHE